MTVQLRSINSRSVERRDDSPQPSTARFSLTKLPPELIIAVGKFLDNRSLLKLALAWHSFLHAFVPALDPRNPSRLIFHKAFLSEHPEEEWLPFLHRLLDGRPMGQWKLPLFGEATTLDALNGFLAETGRRGALLQIHPVVFYLNSIQELPQMYLQQSYMEGPCSRVVKIGLGRYLGSPPLSNRELILLKHLLRHTPWMDSLAMLLPSTHVSTLCVGLAGCKSLAGDLQLICGRLAVAELETLTRTLAYRPTLHLRSLELLGDCRLRLSSTALAFLFCTNLEKLVLFEMGAFPEDDCVNWMRALYMNCTLRSLTLSKSPCIALSLEDICFAVQLNKTLRTLEFPDCDLQDRHAEILCRLLFTDSTLQPPSSSFQNDPLVQMTTLKELNLNGNSFTVEGARTLAQTFLHHPSLASLSLVNNPLSDEGRDTIVKDMMKEGLCIENDEGSSKLFVGPKRRCLILNQ